MSSALGGTEHAGGKQVDDTVPQLWTDGGALCGEELLEVGRKDIGHRIRTGAEVTAADAVVPTG
jgi:hypothetical protein